jgi:hypothetical protein
LAGGKEDNTDKYSSNIDDRSKNTKSTLNTETRETHDEIIKRLDEDDFNYHEGSSDERMAVMMLL